MRQAAARSPATSYASDVGVTPHFGPDYARYEFIGPKAHEIWPYSTDDFAFLAT